jgi:hypothetical protein
MQIFELNHAKKSNTLIESVCRDLTRDQRRIVEGMVRDLRPLFETTLSADQIQQIFQQAQQKQAAQGGAGRTAIGRAVDTTKAVGSAVGTAAGAVNKAIDGLGRYLQTTAPVQYFDQKFEDLKQKISAKLGADSKTMAVIDQLGQYARANPGKTTFVIGALTAVAALTTGPAGGAIAGQVLRGAVELLKGEKLSTAVGKGIKSAAFGYLTGSVLDSIGDWFRTWTLNMVQYTPEIREAEFGWSQTISWQVPGYSETRTQIESIDAYFRNADADRLSQLVNTFNSTSDASVKDQAFNEFRKIFAKVGEPGYFEGALVDDNTARQLAIANNKAYQNTILLTKNIAAAAQGAVQAATGTAKTPAAVPAAPAPAPQVREGYTRLTNKEIREIFAIAGGQLTEGPTWDKIKSVGGKLAQKITNKQVSAANLYRSWEKSGKPDDSGVIADILKTGNVTDDVIQDIYSAMNIEVATPVSLDRPSSAAQPAQPAEIDKLSQISADSWIKRTANQKLEPSAYKDALTKFIDKAMFNVHTEAEHLSPTNRKRMDSIITSIAGAKDNTKRVKELFSALGSLAFQIKQELGTSRSTAAITNIPEPPETAPAAAVQPAPAATPAAAKYSSAMQAVDTIMREVPKDWLPEITAELLKRQRVTATKK